MSNTNDDDHEGASEAAWVDWFRQHPPPSVEPGELVPEGARAVVVAPHPDDEVLGTGGLLATWAALGRTIRIVAVTDGSASHPGSARWRPATLAEARRAESAQGWQRLGLPLGGERRLQLPDGDVPAHEARLTERLCDELAPGDRVFATWRLDGHPDHEATGRAAAAACERRGCTLFEYPVWMWRWALPGDARVPWQRLRRLPIGSRGLERKSHALQAHVTQLEADRADVPPVLPAAMLGHWLRPFECVFVPANR